MKNLQDIIGKIIHNANLKRTGSKWRIEEEV